MSEEKQYVKTDRMRGLISQDPSLLMVLTRFGVSLGFGDKTVDEVCAEHQIDCGTFLAVANFISGHSWNAEEVKLQPLMDYLKNAHAYFLDFNLPLIRRKLIEAIDTSKTDGLGFLILRFYDEYVTEVANHMGLENTRVFPFVESLLQGSPGESFSITKFASRHSYIDPKLKELKDIIVRYYPEKSNDLLNSVLFDIITCERDLFMHCLAEDKLFIPAVKKLEREVAERLAEAEAAQAAPDNNDEIADSDAERLNALSDREKEIICLIARGLANKEIADSLCLSVHTVTTHRRNISQKLQIHSSAGLTIFAIMNGLIPLNEIPRPR